jgi:ribosome-binding protein aMBF1 (putative translation factor)
MNKCLKVMLVEKGIRNFDLAKHLDCDPAKISKIVNGWLEPDPKTRQKIATFLGVNEEEIWQ